VDRTVRILVHSDRRTPGTIEWGDQLVEVGVVLHAVAGHFQGPRWSFLTNHARALLLIAEDPDTRLRDLALALSVTERTAYGIVVDLAEAGYVVKEKDGRRNATRSRPTCRCPTRSDGKGRSARCSTS